MNIIKDLQKQKEESEENIHLFVRARDNLLCSGVLLETCIPIGDREEFRKVVLEWINNKLEIEKGLNEEYSRSLTFYGF